MKIREEADPFSMDLGSVEKGGTVKVLEVSEVAPHISGRSLHSWRRYTAPLHCCYVRMIFGFSLRWNYFVVKF